MKIMSLIFGLGDANSPMVGTRLYFELILPIDGNPNDDVRRKSERKRIVVN